MNLFERIHELSHKLVSGIEPSKGQNTKTYREVISQSIHIFDSSSEQTSKVTAGNEGRVEKQISSTPRAKETQK